MADDHDIPESNEVMTLREVADYLQLADKSVLRMAQDGRIPAAKIASQWRFLRTLVNDWLASQMALPPAARRPGNAAPPQPLPSLSDLMQTRLMDITVRQGTKKEVLARLVEPLQRSDFLRDPKPFLNSLVRREMLASTAVAPAVAFPHPRTPIRGLFQQPAIAFGRCPEGTDFNSLDGNPVHLFFLICASSEEVHLRLMAQLSYLVRRNDIIDQLKSVGSVDDVTRIIRREEAHLPRPD